VGIRCRSPDAFAAGLLRIDNSCVMFDAKYSLVPAVNRGDDKVRSNAGDLLKSVSWTKLREAHILDHVL
jgi:hypothetical protein